MKRRDVSVSTGREDAGQDGPCFDNTAVLTLRVNYADLRRGGVSHTNSESESSSHNATQSEKSGPSVPKIHCDEEVRMICERGSTCVLAE